MKARRKNSLSHFILLTLEKTIDGYVRLEDFLYNPGYYAYSMGWSYPLKKSGLSKAIQRLRENGLVEELKVKEDVILRLTSSGQELIGNDTNTWDGRWRIVSFDIPEEKRIIRNLFRRNLKKWGFKHLQKSVWISKRDVYDRLIKYIEDLGIEKWVTVMEAEKISPSPLVNN